MADTETQDPPIQQMPTVAVRMPQSDKPVKMTRAELIDRMKALGYAPKAAEGVVDNIYRESSGDPTEIGDGGTSLGLFQFHNERKSQLEKFAKDRGMIATDPEAQILFHDYEMQTQYPTLRKQLMDPNTTREAAEDSFKRIYERPASVLWANKSGANPVIQNDGFKYSDFAQQEFKPEDIEFMKPSDYLALSPPMKPGVVTPGQRHLAESLGRGDAIESIPTMDVKIDGPTATVVDQDGRARAMAALQAGVDMMPVAMNRQGQGTPREIVGMQGNAMPYNTAPATQVQQPGQNLFGKIANAIVPSAQAAEMPQGGFTVPPGWMRVQSAAPPQPAPQQAPNGFTPPPGWTPIDNASQQIPQMAPQEPQAQPEGLGGQIVDALGSAASAVGRGLAPIAAGAGIGAGIGAFGMGIGAVPGAVMGATAAAVGEVGTGLYNAVAGAVGAPPAVTPKDITDAVLDAAGVPRSNNPATKFLETLAGALSSTVGGVTAARYIQEIATSKNLPVIREVAKDLQKNYGSQLASAAFAATAQDLVREFGGGKKLQLAASLIASLVPFAGKAAIENLSTLRDPSKAAQNAIAAGYALPPSEITEGSLGRLDAPNFMAGLGGKIKLQQTLASVNEAVTNRLAARDLGLPDEQKLYPEIFEQVRSNAGKAYEALRNIGRINTAANPAFEGNIKSIGRNLRDAAKDYPDMQNPLIDDMIKNLVDQKTPEMGSVLEKIKQLRFDAKANFRSQGDPARLALATAQRQAADYIEEMVEANLATTGKQDLLNAYRKARTIIAKSYDVETATNPATGDVNAQRLAALDWRTDGKMLTGNLKTIANAAGAFYKDLAPIARTGGAESVSVLDEAYAAGMIMHGITHGLLGQIALGGLPFLRGPMRRFLAQPEMQQLMAGLRPKNALTPASVVMSAFPGAVQ